MNEVLAQHQRDVVNDSIEQLLPSQSFSSATMCNVGAPRTSSPKYSMRIALCELASGSGTSAPGSVEFTELLIFVARPGKLLDLLSETGVFLQRPASARPR